jgi:hypothetical protein
VIDVLVDSTIKMKGTAGISMRSDTLSAVLPE